MPKLQMIGTLLLLLLIVAGVQSCKKEENKPPQLSLTEPVEGMVIRLPQQVNISGSVSDDSELHEMSIEIKNSVGATVFTAYPYVHDKESYVIDEHFSTTETGSYRLLVKVRDHDEGLTEQVVNFSVE